MFNRDRTTVLHSIQKIRGYSIGGKAERLFVDIDLEKNDPTVSDVHIDTIMTPSKKKPKKEQKV